MKKTTFTTLITLGLLALQTASAANIVKTNNAVNLNAASSWTNNAVPGVNDTAVWDSTLPAGLTNALGASLSWNGVRVLNPGGPVQIAADGNSLTTGLGGIDLSQATQNLTLSNNVIVGAPQRWNLASGEALTLGGNLSKNTGGAVRFGLATSASVQLTNTSSGLLQIGGIPYGTVNDIDYAAVSGQQIVGGSTIGSLYLPNGSTGKGTYSQMLDFTSGSSYALGGNTVVAGVRLNQPSTGSSWQLTTSGKSAYTFSLNSILVTTNVGNQPVIFNGGGYVRIYDAGELFLFQNNPAASLVFSSSLADIYQANAGSSIVKLGVGTVEIQCASYYTGGTTVYEGELLIDGIGNVGSGALNVYGGDFTAATGATNSAPTVIYSGATNGIAVNSASGQFFQRTNLTFSAGSRLQFVYTNGVSLSSTVAPLVITNAATTLTATTSVNLDILAGLSVGQFPLIKYAALGGNGFAAFSLGAIQPHVSAYLSNNIANSSIDLVVTANNDPLKWAAGSGVWDIATTANWQDATGAATTYQQSGIFADSVIFQDSASGTSPITVTLNTNVAPLSVTASTTKNYTLTGPGGIGGIGSLTKSGTSTLALATTNSFSGGLNLNGGVLNFSTLTNLGAGALNFGGGTLQFASGNSSDISVGTVNFNSGGATIDDGGNTISFAKPVGNSGAGGLTKIGNGTLTLNGTNKFFGNTVIGAGTLALGGSCYLSNSAVIVVGSGATLDVSANSPLVLNSVRSQILAGTGLVNGGVILPAGTTLSPATNGIVGTLSLNNGDLTVSGGTLALDVSISGADQVVVGGNVNFLNGNVALMVTGTLTNGTYRLIQYSGSLLSGPGSSANLTITGFNQSGSLASLSDATSGEIDLIIRSQSGLSEVWQGNVNNYWDDSTANWLNGASASIYGDGDYVVFDDTAAQANVSLQTAVLPNSVTVSNSALSYLFTDGTGTGGGKISGSTGIVKSGNGTLVVDTVNNNSGGVLINGGTLQVGDGSSTGDIGTGNITNNGTLNFMQTDNRTVVGQISGAGALLQQGSATLTLSADNTYSGPTTISSGALQIGNGGGAGSLGTSSVTNNGSLIINRAGTFALYNAITGLGSVALTGPGLVTLSGGETYDGNLYVSNGVAQMGAAQILPNAASVPGSTGALILDGAATVFDLNGFNQTVNELSGNSGNVTNSAAAGTNTLTAGDANAVSFSGSIQDSPSGAKIALVYQGSGSLRLNGANNYSGGTIVGGTGTLIMGPGATIGTGSGQIILSNGTSFYLANNGASHSSAGNTLVIPANSAAALNSGNVANAFNGYITGGATSSNLITGPLTLGLTTEQYPSQSFLGTVVVEPGGSIRYEGDTQDNGGDNATFDVEGTVSSKNGGTINFGALTGGGTVGGSQNLVIGAKGINSAFAGTIGGGNAVVKVGAGTLTFAGTTNNTGFLTNSFLAYIGNTTINAGTLALIAPNTLTNSPTVKLAAASAVLDVSQSGYLDFQMDENSNITNTVVVTNSLFALIPGQTLAGIGTINGSVFVPAGATLNVGLSTGSLTITTNLELAGTANTALNRTNSPNCSEVIAQSLIIDSTATLNITNAGPAFQGGEVFHLFNQSASGFAAMTLPPISSPLSWTNKLAVDGTLVVLGSLVNTNVTSITNVLVGNTLILSWPTDHIGWLLQVQTNALSLGLGTNWVNVAGANATNQASLLINPQSGSVFYRLVSP